MLGLTRLFGGKEEKAPAAQPVPPTIASLNKSSPTAGQHAAFVRQEAVFNDRSRLAGHVYRLQHSDAGLGDAPTRKQRPLDDALLENLAAGLGEGAGQPGHLAFVPLCSASLDNPWLERLPAERTVLLIVLAPETGDARTLTRRLQALRQKGLRIGLVRQPKHPLFSAALGLSSFAAVDVGHSEGGQVRDFSVVIRNSELHPPLQLFAANIETLDDHHLARQCRFNFFHGPYFKAGAASDQAKGDPRKPHLLHLMNLVQSNADSAEISRAFKRDPFLTFRILRYLNSPALGLGREISAIDQAIIILGRQRLARWLSVLLFSVKEPDFADWLMVESALVRGRLMEILGEQGFSAAEKDHLFLTGVFSTLDRLLRMPLAEAVNQLQLPADIRRALLEGSGPYAPLLAVAAACEAFDPPRIEAAAREAGLEAASVNRALLSATGWASEVCADWE